MQIRVISEPPALPMMTAWRAIFFAFVAQTATDYLPPGRGDVSRDFFQFVSLHAIAGNRNAGIVIAHVLLKTFHHRSAITAIQKPRPTSPTNPWRT